MSTFTHFFALPKELRDMIWASSAPTVATVSFGEDEYLVTFLTPPPAHLTTSKEAQTSATSWNLTKYPMWGPEDSEDFYFDAESMVLQLIITPTTSKSESADASNVTWTDIWSVLGDALPAAQHLHLMCSKPERLARLFMQEEGGVGVGQSCIESGLFTNPESVHDECNAREQLHQRLTVTASKHTVEEIDEKGGEVDVWRIGDEEVFDDFARKTKAFTTKAFARVEMVREREMSVMRHHVAAKIPAVPVPTSSKKEEEEAVEEEVVEKPGMQLTQDALARHLAEMKILYPKTVSEEDEKDPGGSISDFD